MALNEEQVYRYARHILIPDVGGRGQMRLLQARIALPVGPGRGAELTALAYLAAAGVGHLALRGDLAGPVGEDEVKGGILLAVADVGRPRIDAIRDRVAALNPDVRVEVDDGSEAPALEFAPSTDVAEALLEVGKAATWLLSRIARGCHEPAQ